MQSERKIRRHFWLAVYDHARQNTTQKERKTKLRRVVIVCYLESWIVMISNSEMHEMNDSEDLKWGRVAAFGVFPGALRAGG